MEQGSLSDGGANNSLIITTARQEPSSSGTSACHECGNQAKKDCNYHRCRTCCKSRGFICPTHVKSTWVPAAKRRERQQAEAVAKANGEPVHNAAKTKRPRTASMASASTTGLGPDPSSTREDLLSIGPVQGIGGKSSLPTEVTVETLLKSVKVTGIVEGVLEVGYHASVKIGGHVFKGVLYNTGFDTGSSSTMGTSSSEQAAAHCQDLGNLLALKGNPSASLLEAAGLYGPSAALLGSGPKSGVLSEDHVAANVQSMVRMLSREWAHMKMIEGTPGAMWEKNTHNKFASEST